MLFNKGLGFSAINSAKSAVQTFVATCNGEQQPKTHWLISKFLKGVFYTKTSSPQKQCYLGPYTGVKFFGIMASFGITVSD